MGICASSQVTPSSSSSDGSGESGSARKWAHLEFDGSVAPSIQEKIVACTGILDLHQEEGVAISATPKIRVLPAAAIASSEFLAQLTELHLARNDLKELPAYPGMTSLKVLDVASNRISSVGESVRHLVALEKLDVSECGLTSIDPAIGQLKQLQALAAFKNELTTIPEEIGECHSLADINFYNNKIIRVPASLARMVSIEDVNFGSNKLKTFPAPESWPACTKIALQWNNLVMLPSLSGASACKQLFLGGNKFLPALPALRGMHGSLEMIDFSECGVESLGDDLPNMRQLVNINASKNKIRTLPEDLSQLQALEVFNIQGNELTALPASIGTLPKLRVLFVQKNGLTDLPASLGDCTELARLNATDNPLEVSERLKETLAGLRAAAADKGGFVRVPRELA